MWESHNAVADVTGGTPPKKMPLIIKLLLEPKLFSGRVGHAEVEWLWLVTAPAATANCGSDAACVVPAAGE